MRSGGRNSKSSRRERDRELGPRRRSPRGEPRSRRRLWVFRVLAAALPVVLLLGIEFGCRAFGLGGYAPLLERLGSDGQRQWYATSRPGVDSFFLRHAGATGGMRELSFATPKLPRTVRIGFFGDSAVQGYPQPLPLTNGSFLEAMLDDAWGGDLHAEVLNFGCTAVASFVSMHILEAALERDLDLVVIMAGNNEYFGAYGVASVHGAGARPRIMQLVRWSRQLALVQWFGTVLAPPAPKAEDRRQVLMERVAAVRQIGPDDRRRDAASNAAATHLGRMVGMARGRGIPTILCTLPTNERDLAPIGLDLAPDLEPAARAEFGDEVERGEARLESDPSAAADLLRSATVRWSRHARAHHLLGRALTALGRHPEALREYVLARDLDTMPWRATSAIQDAARAAAAAHPGAILCDMEAAFRAASPGGAIGWELVDDHVHLTQRGQALFAETLARAMSVLPDRMRVDAARLDHLPGWEVYAERLGRNLYDEYASALHMKKLFDAEFMSRTNPAARQRAARRIEALRARMSSLDLRAVDEWADVRQANMTVDRPITSVVGSYHRMTGDWAGAATCFRMSRRSVSAVSFWKLKESVELLRCSRHLRTTPSPEDRALAREAIEVGELLRRFARLPDPAGHRDLGLAYHYAGEPATAIDHLAHAVRFEKGRESIDVVTALAEALLQTGQIDRARKLLDLAQQDPEIRDRALAMLAELEKAVSSPQPAAP